MVSGSLVPLPGGARAAPPRAGPAPQAAAIPPRPAETLTYYVLYTIYYARCTIHCTVQVQSVVLHSGPVHYAAFQLAMATFALGAMLVYLGRIHRSGGL